MCLKTTKREEESKGEEKNDEGTTQTTSADGHTCSQDDDTPKSE